MEPSLNETLESLARQYAEVALEVLGDRLTSVVLYGSVARGEARPQSDIDLFIVLRDAPRGMSRRRALLEPVRQRRTADLEVLWERGVYTDFVEVIRTEEEAQRFHPIYLDMTLEAKPLFDRGGFFSRILERVRQRLEALGARRRAMGRTWYWDLKPSFKPGEVIEV